MIEFYVEFSVKGLIKKITAKKKQNKTKRKQEIEFCVEFSVNGLIKKNTAIINKKETEDRILCRVQSKWTDKEKHSEKNTKKETEDRVL